MKKDNFKIEIEHEGVVLKPGDRIIFDELANEKFIGLVAYAGSSGWFVLHNFDCIPLFETKNIKIMNKENPKKSKDFSVITYETNPDKKKYKHWSDDLNMIITKDGATIKLDGVEISKIIDTLPRTVGGSY